MNKERKIILDTLNWAKSELKEMTSHKMDKAETPYRDCRIDVLTKVIKKLTAPENEEVAILTKQELELYTKQVRITAIQECRHDIDTWQEIADGMTGEVERGFKIAMRTFKDSLWKLITNESS